MDLAKLVAKKFTLDDKNEVEIVEPEKLDFQS